MLNEIVTMGESNDDSKQGGSNNRSKNDHNGANCSDGNSSSSNNDNSGQNQGGRSSNNKNNDNRSHSLTGFKGANEKLKGHVFRHGRSKNRDKHHKTAKAIIQHVAE